MGRALALATAGLLTATGALAQDNAAVANAAANAAEPAANAATTAAPATIAPITGLGMPTAGESIQPQVTALGQRAADFHNGPLLIMCFVISAFVLLLMLYVMIRFNRRANPTPSKNSHNTTLEVVWTLVPVLILVAIAVPSIRLIRAQYSPPPADLTIKVVGHQWYWSYQYPDNGGFEIVSNILKEANDPTRAKDARARTDADGPPQLAVDERMVIPAGKVVKFLITSEDVIHSFAVPAFWTKMDANPGRINETWVKVDKPGVYFGQCSELCGARHGYMPIAVEVLPEAQFNAWLAAKGGSPKGAKPTEATKLDAAADVGTKPTPADAAAAALSENVAAPAPATNQAATAQN